MVMTRTRETFPTVTEHDTQQFEYGQCGNVLMGVGMDTYKQGQPLSVPAHRL